MSEVKHKLYYAFIILLTFVVSLAAVSFAYYTPETNYSTDLEVGNQLIKLQSDDLFDNEVIVEAQSVKVININILNGSDNNSSFKVSYTSDKPLVDVYTLDNYLNNRETYSTSEQVIGTWIDGKPIYRKVINSVLNGTYIESGYRFTWINDGVNNIDTIKDVSGLIIYSDRTSPIGKDGNSSICYRNGQGIQIGAIEGMHPYNIQCSVWIEYTKTTD